MTLHGQSGHPRSLSALVFLVGIACAPAPAFTSPPRAAGAAPAMVSLGPTRPAGECVDLVARVVAHPDSFQGRPPLLARFETPPMDVPPGLAGRTIHVRVVVDPRGRVVPDSITLTPEIADRGYRAKLIANIRNYTYTPALVDGCAVPGASITDITLARRF